VRTLLKLALGLWLARWAAGEVAAYAGRHWRKHGPPPIESERAPGWMPGPGKRPLGPDRGI
jgi:hypothetical protein